MKSVREIIDRLRRVGVYPFYEENILEDWAEEIREDQRKKCAEVFVAMWQRTHTWQLLREAILNAGKVEEK